MLNEGGSRLASISRVRCGWKKFRELSGILTSKKVALRLKGKVYGACVQSSMIYGSETWKKTFILTRLFFPVYWGQPHLWPFHNIFLHLDLSQASSLQSPFSLISSLNTSLHLFLGLPFTPLPSTCSVSILFNQHNSSLLSTWPNHLSLFCCITSPMSSIASMF